MEKEQKYFHKVSYYFDSQGTGVMEVLNNIESYKTKTQLKELESFIQSFNKSKDISITNIFTVLNK